MAQRSFKIDESLLEKLAIGAIGTQKVIEDLTNQGYTPVELERGSTGYKIWKTIKWASPRRNRLGILRGEL